MDPNVTLQDMMSLMHRILKDYEDEDGNGVELDDAVTLASHVESLNAWLRGGGFLPDEWTTATVASTSDLFDDILKGLEANESLCCDNESDRAKLAFRLTKHLARR